jgi:hypothetical protein
MKLDLFRTKILLELRLEVDQFIIGNVGTMLGVGAVMVRIGVPLIQHCRRTAHKRESSVPSEIEVVDVTAKWNVKNETSFTI